MHASSKGLFKIDAVLNAVVLFSVAHPSSIFHFCTLLFVWDEQPYAPCRRTESPKTADTKFGCDVLLPVRYTVCHLGIGFSNDVKL